MRINISNVAKYIIERLNAKGFQCYAVGGCIRDLIRGDVPYDYDFTTNASPDEIEDTFKDLQVYSIGKKFGTVCVMMGGFKYEITTYRIDGKYSDKRHPDEVIFSNDLKDDLSRRDFTINAAAYNPKSGLVDMYSSLSDIKAGLIRCVGDPYDRFDEDALRILRALRFASRYNYKIETKTSVAIHKSKNLLDNIAKERIASELTGILTGDGAEYVLMEYRDVIGYIIPECREMFGYDQNSPHHCYDLWTHTVKAVAGVEKQESLKLAMLLHDIAKPQTRTIDDKGIAHYHGHPDISSYMSECILKNLKFSNDMIKEVKTLIKYHDIRFNGSNSNIRKVLRVTSPQIMEKIFLVQRADLSAQGDFKRHEKEQLLEKTQREFEYIIKTNECYSLKQLAINGNDLKSIGILKGEHIGQILDMCLTAVINGVQENKRKNLLELAISLEEKFDK